MTCRSDIRTQGRKYARKREYISLLGLHNKYYNFSNRNSLAHSSRGEKSKFKALGGSAPSQDVEDLSHVFPLPLEVLWHSLA